MVIDEKGTLLAETRQTYGDDKSVEARAPSWKRALFGLFEDMPSELRSTVASIAIDGTSSTCMLMDEDSGELLTTPLMYNEACPEAAAMVAGFAPAGHTVTAGTSTLCKLVQWQKDGLIPDSGSPRLTHQADWLGYLLHQMPGVTDYNNALKLGYDPDPKIEAFPNWMLTEELAPVLPPKVVAPGEVVGAVAPAVAAELGLPEGAVVCGGTTDSIAAFLAAGVSRPGQAVTSLGSTLAIKLLSTKRLDDASSGIYSHRLDDMWLVGGASNTGGAVLRGLFSDAELKALSAEIDPAEDSGLDYYPLTAPGERFPVNDPNLQPRLEPRPPSVLESIARIEGMAFKMFEEQGASRLEEVYTAGGGAANAMWTTMRSRILGVKVAPSPQVEAAYGAAVLARKGILGSYL